MGLPQNYYLGCTSTKIILQGLQEHLHALADSVSAGRAVEYSHAFIQFSDGAREPLSAQDVSSQLSSEHCAAITQALWTSMAADVLHGSRSLRTVSGDKVLHSCLQWCGDVSACVSEAQRLLQHMPAPGTSPRMPLSPGSVDIDKQLRNCIAKIIDVLDEAVPSTATSQSGNDTSTKPALMYGSYMRPPLPLYATLMHCGLASLLVGLLVGRSMNELSSRGTLFFEVLRLVRHLSRMPDAAAVLQQRVPAPASLVQTTTVVACMYEAHLMADLCLSHESSGGRVTTSPSNGESGARETMKKMARRLASTYHDISRQAERVADAAMLSGVSQRGVIPGALDSQVVNYAAAGLQQLNLGEAVRAPTDNSTWAASGMPKAFYPQAQQPPAAQQQHQQYIQQQQQQYLTRAYSQEVQAGSTAGASPAWGSEPQPPQYATAPGYSQAPYPVPAAAYATAPAGRRATYDNTHGSSGYVQMAAGYPSMQQPAAVPAQHAFQSATAPAGLHAWQEHHSSKQQPATTFQQTAPHASSYQAPPQLQQQPQRQVTYEGFSYQAGSQKSTNTGPRPLPPQPPPEPQASTASPRIAQLQEQVQELRQQVERHQQQRYQQEVAQLQPDIITTAIPLPAPSDVPALAPPPAPVMPSYPDIPKATGYAVEKPAMSMAQAAAEPHTQYPSVQPTSTAAVPPGDASRDQDARRHTGVGIAHGRDQERDQYVTLVEHIPIPSSGPSHDISYAPHFAAAAALDQPTTSHAPQHTAHTAPAATAYPSTSYYAGGRDDQGAPTGETLILVQGTGSEGRQEEDVRDLNSTGPGRLSDVELIGVKLPLMLLADRYAESSPLLAARLVSLEGDFTHFRRVAGDGNCFYRAFLFALLEYVMSAPSPSICTRLHKRCKELVAALTLQPPTSDPSMLEGALRGGRALAQLLSRCWFLDDVEEPVDVADLEKLLSKHVAPTSLVAQAGRTGGSSDSGSGSGGGLAASSNDVVQFARLVTSRELRSNEAMYAPFINGCGSDYRDLSLTSICDLHVDRMGKDAEQLQIVALLRAIDVRGLSLGILDVGGSEVGYVKHPGHEGPPLFWLAHLPGHYDVLYAARSMDVVGGMLIEAKL